MGPIESVWLPSGTLKVKGKAVCASLNRLSIERCFNLNRTGDQSFRGSISGLDIAYCDFTRRVSLTDERPAWGRSRSRLPRGDRDVLAFLRDTRSSHRGLNVPDKLLALADEVIE